MTGLITKPCYWRGTACDALDDSAMGQTLCSFMHNLVDHKAMLQALHQTGDALEDYAIEASHVQLRA